MNKFQSWEMGEAEEDSCNKCGMSTSKSMGCCRDEVKVIKLQQDLVKASAVVYHFALPAIVSSTPSWFLSSLQTTLALQDYRINGPPLLSKQDTYLNNCVFRI